MLSILFYAYAINGLARGFYAYPDSVYRTFLRFPHRLTIPAFEECFAVLLCFFACTICFLMEMYKLHYARVIFYNRLLSYGLWEVSAVPLLFRFPGYCVLCRQTATNFYFLLLLENF